MQVAHGMVEDLNACYGALHDLPGRLSLNSLLRSYGLLPIFGIEREPSGITCCRCPFASSGVFLKNVRGDDQPCRLQFWTCAGCDMQHVP